MQSRTRQDKLNKEIDEKGGNFISQFLVPWLKERLADISAVRVTASEHDPHIIEVRYASFTPAKYLPDVISQEIGPLAASVPSSWRTIVPYVSERFENVVGRIEAPVRATSAERTFWEKATILHQQAYSPKDIPPRYARHYYVGPARLRCRY